MTHFPFSKIKKISRQILIGIFLMISFQPKAQNETNKEFLNQFAAEKSAESQQQQQRAKIYAVENNIPIRKVSSEGKIIELIDVVDGKPIFYTTDNLGAATTTRANKLWTNGGLNLSIEGEGYDKVAIWDGGAVSTTHSEFNNTGTARVTQMDNASQISDHATHVAGTIVAGGVDNNAKGMAHKAQLKAYEWTDASGELSTAAANGLEISSNSWGFITGWYQNGDWVWAGNSEISAIEDYKFGFYTSNARDWDVISRNAPYLLICKSSGNDRGEGPYNAGQNGQPNFDGGNEGYDCISDMGVAKNVLTVGAAYGVYNYTGPNSVYMSSFSSWGPTDDGRIKPDVVGKGVDVYSTIPNNYYTSMNGTSMSTPNVSGTLVLLQQLYQQTHNGTRMRSSTLKGLVIHTADECGTTAGPDYMFG